MDQSGGWFDAESGGCDFAETAADRQQAVAVLHDAAREAGSLPAETVPQPQRVALRKNSLAAERRRHRRSELLGQRNQEVRGAGGALAEVEGRGLGVGHHGGGSLHEVRIGCGAGIRLGLVVSLADLLPQHEELGGDLDRHRSGNASAGDLKRTADGRVEVFGAFHPHRLFRDRTQRRQLVDRVELEGRSGVGADAGCEHHHRHVVHPRLGDARHAEGHPGAGDHVDDPDLVRRTGEAVGEKGAGDFGGYENGLDTVRCGEGVVELDVVGARDAERVANALILEGADDLLRGSRFHAKSSPALVRMPSATRSASAMTVT